MRKRKRNRLQNRDFFDSVIMNNATFQEYFDKLCMIAMTRFRTLNLPETIDPIFMEKWLLQDGHMVYFNDEIMGNLCLRANLTGRPDVYDIPTRREIYTASGYRKRLNRNDSVVIYDNPLHKPIIFPLKIFAMRLWHCDMVSDVNVESQKTPILLRVPEKMKLTAENIYMEYTGNQPVVCAYDGFDPEAFTVLKTDAPYVADKMQTLKEQIWNDALTFLGVSNVRYEKKERINTDEVQKGMGGTTACLVSRSITREYAYEQINKMFGTNLILETNDDLNVTMPSVAQKGDDQSVEIHDNPL